MTPKKDLTCVLTSVPIFVFGTVLTLSRYPKSRCPKMSKITLKMNQTPVSSSPPLAPLRRDRREEFGDEDDIVFLIYLREGFGHLWTPRFFGRLESVKTVQLDPLVATRDAESFVFIRLHGDTLTRRLYPRFLVCILAVNGRNGLQRVTRPCTERPNIGTLLLQQLVFPSACVGTVNRFSFLVYACGRKF